MISSIATRLWYIPKAEAFIEHIKELIAIETEESHT